MESGYNMPQLSYGGYQEMPQQMMYSPSMPSPMNSPSGYQPQGQMIQRTQHGHGKGIRIVAIIALIIAIISMLWVVILSVFYGFARNVDSKHPAWEVTVSSGNDITYNAGGDDMVRVEGTTTNGKVTIYPPENQNDLTSPYVDRIFMVDNMSNSNSIIVQPGTGVRMTDNTSVRGRVNAHTTAMYIWDTASPSPRFRRLM